MIDPPFWAYLAFAFAGLVVMFGIVVLMAKWKPNSKSSGRLQYAEDEKLNLDEDFVMSIEPKDLRKAMIRGLKIQAVTKVPPGTFRDQMHPEGSAMSSHDNP
jgi:hypothetical protein